MAAWKAVPRRVTTDSQTVGLNLSLLLFLLLQEEEEEEVVVEEEEEEEEEQGGGEEVEVEEVEIVNIIQQKPPPAIERISRTVVGTELREGPQPVKMDTRYFGELLADVYRKNCDIHSFRGTKQDENQISLIPKGATELTKQQIRYLLQTRLTADKSMRLLLATFSSLREELLHMSEDLRCLESEKESLERDLSFKADQARQYDSLLEAVRENNRQLQVLASQRSLESQLMSSRNTDSSREFKVKELEGRMRALEKENEMLRQKVQTLPEGKQMRTQRKYLEEELAKYNENHMKFFSYFCFHPQKNCRLIGNLTSLVAALQHYIFMFQPFYFNNFLLLLLNSLMFSDTLKKQKLCACACRYRNQYPILGLLSDDYQYTSPIKEDKTIVIESSRQSYTCTGNRSC
uniref:POF1B actin binding protein n=1 Tax=Scophthalmus maximus TaxID=52904 RepID=A0A8D3DNE0_SCOMX